MDAIFVFFQILGCELTENTLFVTPTGEVLYNSNQPIAGFQFDVDGATITGASGGVADVNGFTVYTGDSTVLAFSFT